MRTPLVVLPPIGLEDDASLDHVAEELPVEQFIAEACVEGFGVAVLPSPSEELAPRNDHEMDALIGILAAARFLAVDSPAPSSPEQPARYRGGVDLAVR